MLLMSFSAIFITPKFPDTIQQLKTERTDPLRPSFGETQADHEIVELAFECWSETPEKRPKFSEIRKKLHNIRRYVHYLCPVYYAIEISLRLCFADYVLYFTSFCKYL